MADRNDHDEAILVITMAEIRNRALMGVVTTLQPEHQ